MELPLDQTLPERTNDTEVLQAPSQRTKSRIFEKQPFANEKYVPENASHGTTQKWENSTRVRKKLGKLARKPSPSKCLYHDVYVSVLYFDVLKEGQKYLKCDKD